MASALPALVAGSCTHVLLVTAMAQFKFSPHLVLARFCSKGLVAALRFLCCHTHQRHRAPLTSPPPYTPCGSCGCWSSILSCPYLQFMMPFHLHCKCRFGVLVLLSRCFICFYMKVQRNLKLCYLFYHLSRTFPNAFEC